MNQKNKSETPNELITNVAVRLFSEQGYNGTTMRDIAKEVGILPGSLYAHIDSKEAMLLNIVQTGIQPFLDIEQLVNANSLSPTQRLSIAIKAHIAIIANDTERTLVVFHQWRYLSKENKSIASVLRRKYAETYMKIVSDGIACGEFSPQLDKRIAVFAILGALNWTSEWYSPKGKQNAEQISEKITDFMIFALRHGMIVSKKISASVKTAKSKKLGSSASIKATVKTPVKSTSRGAKK
jgi:TetR/AcrR family transcriptional regulator, cholesterol catabolism regulator